LRAAFSSVIATASADQSVRAGQRGGDAREAEPAAELEHAHAAQRARRERAGERDAARPELGPVRQVLLALERLLVEQVLAVARADDGEPPPAERHRLLDHVDLDPAEAHRDRIAVL
jgi:hypothetical protein